MTQQHQPDAIERAQAYGVRMNESLSSAEIAEMHDRVDHSVTVYWNCTDLKRITRLRLIGYCREYRWWDVSYCYGELEDGREVRVQVPFGRLGKLWASDIIKYARQDKVYAKGLGILDNDVVSRLYG